MVKSELIRATIEGLGYELIDTEWGSGGVLRVFIDIKNGQAGQSVQVVDCEKVTHQLQTVLEVEEVEYRQLEVSSPGLDRPLRSAQDLNRFCGCFVEIVLKSTPALANEPNLQRKYFGRLGKIEATTDKWTLELLENKILLKKKRKISKWEPFKDPKFIEFSWLDLDKAKLAEDRFVG
ncbi:MAG: ribosome maturation factor RimP [Gammaproteobacteria bacterium]|nr:ribosome maturation factor RimP [Gammaproteobacteria bacterium]